MHKDKNGYEQNEEHYDDYGDVLEGKPAQISNIPPRASAHPSAIAAVRPKYPRSFSDQQRITPFDGISPNLPVLTRSAVSQRRTDDLLTEHIFRAVEDPVPIDEIDTHPPDVQARLRPESQRSAYEPVSQVDTLPTSFVYGKQGAAYPRVETRQWTPTQLPDGVGQTAQPHRFSIKHCLDNVRWWLLFPGRLEFLLWLIGAIVLVCLTSCFLLMIKAVWFR
jgi:hypothetical protein